MKGMQSKQVMSGAHGELWIDGDYMSQVTAFKAEINIEKTEVKMIKKQFKQYKVVGLEGKGSVKMNHISSYMMSKISENIKAGKQTICTIISNLDDPDAIGAERVVIKDAVFDKLILADWEVGKMTEDAYDFTFSDYDILDSADE